MSRWGACFLVTLLLIPALAATAQEENVRDEFNAVSFSGNDGSLPWAGPWTEVGESDGPASGQVKVGSINCSASKCLQLSGGALGQPGAQREADLSTMVTAVLSLDLIVDAALFSTGTLRIQARESGSGTWVTLKGYTLLLQNGQFSESFDVSQYAGSEFEVRFVLSSLLGGDRAYFDEVTIEGTVAATSSSTSTSSSSSTSTSISISTSSSISISTSTTSAGGLVTSLPSTPDGVPGIVVPGITPSPPDNTTPTGQVEPPTDEGGATVAIPPGSVSPDDGVGDPTSSTSTTARDGIVIVPLSEPTSAIGGLREAGVGVLADYRSGMMGDTDFEDVEVLGASLEADFSMAVEVFEAMRLWIAALALVVTAAIVGGMDVVRTRASGEKPPHDDNSLS
jgi:hypothetical protein